MYLKIKQNGQIVKQHVGEELGGEMGEELGEELDLYKTLSV